MHLWVEQTVQDLRYALRGLRRNPGFTLTAVAAAAIAIGASTAVFSAVDRILFRPLPYRDDGRLVSAGIMAPLDTTEFMLADAYFDLRRNPGPFVAVTSFQAGGIACDLTEQSPVRLRCMRVEGNFLETLGVRLTAGRPFSAEEDRPNGPRVAIISDALWRSRFAANPAAIGKALNIDGVPTRVAGVLPPDFVMPTLAHADILLPEALDAEFRRPYRTLDGYLSVLPTPDRHWQAFFTEIGRPELTSDPRFVTGTARNLNLPDLYGLLESELSQRSTAHWLTVLQKVGIPHSAINGLTSLVTDEHAMAVGLFETRQDAVGHTVRRVRSPLLFSAGALPDIGVAPVLGQHTAEILGEIGYDQAQIADLLAAGVIRQWQG